MYLLLEGVVVWRSALHIWTLIPSWWHCFGGESYTSGVISEVFIASPSFQFSVSCQWLRTGSLSVLLLPPSCHDGLLALQNGKSKNSFFNKTFLVRMLYHSNRIVTKTGCHVFSIVKNSLTKSNQGGKSLFYFGLQHILATFCCCSRHHDPATQTLKGLLGLQFQRKLRQRAWCQENSFWSTRTKQKEKTWRRQSLKSQSPPVIHSLTRPHQLSIPKQQHHLGTKCSNTCIYKAYSQSYHHTVGM